MIFFCIVESLIQHSILLSLVRTLSNVRFSHDYRHHLHQSSEVSQGQRVAVDGVGRGECDVQAAQARGERGPAVPGEHLTKPAETVIIMNNQIEQNPQLMYSLRTVFPEKERQANRKKCNTGIGMQGMLKNFHFPRIKT